MRTLYLRILRMSGEILTQLAMECGRRKCDNCPIYAKCSKVDGVALGRGGNGKMIEVSHRWALRNLEYHDNGVWLVWKNSKAKKKDGEFVKMFFQPLWCENKVNCDTCEHRFYCYTNKGENIEKANNS